MQEQIQIENKLILDVKERAYATGKRKNSIARVWLKIGERTVIEVPRSAVRIDGELRAVYVMDSEKRPQLRQVYTGRVDQQQVEIQAGLKAGERVLEDWSQIHYE